MSSYETSRQVPRVPPASRGAAKSEALKAEARRMIAAAGEPFLFRMGAKAGMASNLRAGRIAAFTPRSEWKIETRKSTRGPDLIDIYITYVGDDL